LKETSQRTVGWRRYIGALLLLCGAVVLSPKLVRAQSVLLGDQSVENQVDMNVKGMAEAFQSTATTTGQLSYINIYLDSSSTAGQIVVGIYADNGGHPGTLVTQGTSSGPLVAGNWNAIAVTPATITSGVHYWITILGTQSGVPHFRDTTGAGCKSETSSQTTLTTLPSSWTTGTVYGTCPISAYGLNGPPMGTSVLIGELAIENYVDTNPVGRAEAFQATANATGTVTAINLYIDSTSQAPNVYVGLYSDSNGNPGTLLGQGNTTHPVAGAWNQISISSASITAGKPYWIAVLGPQSGLIKFRDRASGPCHSQTTASQTLTSLPASWTTGTVYPTCPLSAYGITTSNTLVVSPSSITFTAPQGGANPAPASLSVTTTGTGTPAFTASSDSSWLTVSPTSGSIPKVLQVSAAVGSLTAGTYTGHITVTSSGLQGSPTVIPVTFCVTGGTGPNISSLSPTSGLVGTSVTITGTNFGTTGTVTFNGTPATPSSYSSTSIKVPVPSGATTGPVMVKVGTISSNPVNFAVTTLPQIVATASPAPNGNGWNNTNVTVTFTCVPGSNPIQTCPAPIIVSTEGKNQVITGTVVDTGGQTASASVTVSIDKTPPTITATPSPAPNANGWNNTSVTVSFKTSDALSGVDTCDPPVTVTAEGTTVVTGTVKDKAGNTATVSITVKIDKTPPTISAVVTPTPVNGINTGPVTITFTCTDALSGVATCPPPLSVTTTGGVAKSFSGTAVDEAGNSATATVSVNIQPGTTPPTITAVASPAPNANGWNNSNVTVTFTCTAGSNPIQTCPSPVVVSTEGANQVISGTATDTAGKTATASVTVSLDKTPPVITAVQSPAANANGWNNSNVTVTFTCSDALSGLAGTCPAAVTVTTEGTTPVTGSVTDKAGNTSSATVSVKIDKTPPTITAVASSAPNANGWNNSNVTVNFTCADSGSGIATCPAAVTVSTEAANQVVSGTATDKAGNTASTSVSVSLDKTPPTITATVTPTPVNGINTGPVTISFVCSDALSGVSICPSVINISTTSGAPQTFTGTATDKAGNSTTASVVVNIQPPANPPTLTPIAAPAANAAGWNNTNVTVSFTCTAGSNPIQTCPAPIVVTTEGANQSICGTVTDTSGKTATACLMLNIDKTPPTLTATPSPAPNAAGWNKGPVTVTFTCADSLSGPTGNPSPFADSTEGITPVTASCSDRAGNTGSTTLTVKIDVTPPVIAASISPAPNASGWNSSNVTVTFNCTDSGSGVASCSPPVTITTEGAGQQVTGTATDVAGNTASKTVTINLSKTGPSITAVASPPPNAAGWNDSNVTVTFTCTAGGAPIASCPAAQTVSTEGAGQIISGTVTDLAGLTATASVTVSLDKTPPTGTATATPAPNAAGWNNTPVTVSFACADTLSGITANPPNVVVSTEGTTPATGTCTDKAGNTASVTLSVKIDKTPPTIVGTIAPAPNANGWNTSNVTVSFTCADSGSGVAACSPSVPVTTEGAGQSFTGTATDFAGNTATTTVTVNLSKTAPKIIAVVSPSPNAAGWNNSPVTVSFTCTAGGAPINTCPPSQSVNTDGANQSVTATVTDASGTTATATAKVSLDRTPPTITATPTPSPNANGYYTSAVTVNFVCADALSGVAICPSPVTISTEGSNQSVTGTAVDVAGNSALASISLNIEKSLPTITASVAPPPNAAGWNNTDVTITYNCAATVSMISNCPPPKTVSTEGAGQIITATVADGAGNQATTSVTLNIDKTAPTILQLVTPSQLSSTGSAVVTLTATDNIAVASVIFSVNGAPVATLFSQPYQFTLTVPSTANVGDTLVVTAAVSDLAGNTNTASRGVTVVANGVVVGQVLSDLNGLPLQNAIVQVVGASLQTSSDPAGRYTIPVSSNHLFLQVTQPADPIAQTPASVTVEREVFVQSGVGTVPVDARLTPIAAPVSIDANGGTLTAATVTVTVPANSVPAATPFYLTTLSGQGLPGLLPLGWSPVVVFDLRSDAATSVQFTTNFTQLPQNQSLQLVTYNAGIHAWTMVTPNLTSTDGTLPSLLPTVGSYALVLADTTIPTLTVPASGQPLPGSAMVLLPPDATSSGSLNPASIPPTGGTSTATLPVQSSVALPSGTVIQSNLTERYTLTTGTIIADQARSEDIVLYDFQAPPGAAAVATFPVTPSHTFQISSLQSGKVHLDILAGRESVRGDTGGNTAVVVQSGDATLAIAAGSLTQNTAINVTPETIADFLPSVSGLTPLAQYVLDFSDQMLTAPAQLSASAGSAQPGDNLLLVLIQRSKGVPQLVVVSLAQVTGNQMVSQPYPGLPGIIQGGEYVFYKSVQPIGFVAGAVSANGTPVTALVQSDMLPFVTVASMSGQYILPVVAGAANLTASLAKTALVGGGSISVLAGQTATLNLTLTGSVESATVTPPDGTVGASLTPEIDVVAPDAFNVSTVTAANVQLFQVGGTSGNQPVAVQFVFSQAGKQLAVFPLSGLQPSTKYTFQASGLANMAGGLIIVPTVSFTTQANTPPAFNPNALVFGMPDQNGNVQVTAPAGSFPPATTILIVDQTNGVVLSLTAFNDGSVTGQMPATINDTLVVTITAPDKTTATLTISQFVAPDGTTAIGPGGGTVAGPGNTGLIIPAGAVSRGVTFKLTPLDQTAFPTLPTWQGANFGSGLHIDAPAMPVFNKEVKLAFPVPAGAPKNAFYYVYRRLTDQNGNVYFETIDHAFVQGTGASAQVVTASPPFCGYHNPIGNFNVAVAASGAAAFIPQFSPIQDFIIMWDIPQTDPNLPGVASQGLIVGLIQQIVPATATTLQTTQPYSDYVMVTLDGNSNAVAVYDPACSTFSMFDPQFGGGTRSVTAKGPAIMRNGNTQPNTVIHAIVDEVNGIQANDATYAIYAGLEAQYRNIGRVNFNFPPSTPPPPPPQINIMLYTLDSNNLRVPVKGVVQSGTQMVIAFQTSLLMAGASVNGVQQNIVQDYGDGHNEPLLATSRIQGFYSPGVPGVYTVTAIAEPQGSTQTVSVSTNFLVVGVGGGNTGITKGQAPEVVYTVPANNAQNVSTTVFPQIVFSEPVTSVISKNVTLALQSSPTSPVPLNLIGVKTDGTIANPVGATDAIVSLTIEPLTGLQFGQTYTINLNQNIQNNCASNTLAPDGTQLITDQNTPPLCLPNFTSSFTTFGPSQLGQVNSMQYEILTRPVAIGQRAYAGEFVNSAVSGVGVFDISNPANPQDEGVKASFIGRVTDAAGLANSPANNGGGVIAFAAGTAVDNAIPGNVYLYDLKSPDQPTLFGAVSVSTSATQAGIALRLFMKDQFLYASTFLQGLQVIDVGQAIQEYASTSPSTRGQALSTEGDGFAMDTIVNNIQLPLPNQGGTATMFDLAVDDFVLSGGGSGSSPATQPLIVATGQPVPLVVADPLLGGLQAVVYPPATGGGLSQPTLMATRMNQDTSTPPTPAIFCLGHYVALGTIPVTTQTTNGTVTTVMTANKHIALLAGFGVINPAQGATCSAATKYSPMLMTFDLSAPYSSGQPYTPKPMGYFPLASTATDILLRGSIALVATGTDILVVNLSDPTQPVDGGKISCGPSGTTCNFGNGIALTSSGLIVSTSMTPLTNASVPGSLHIAAIDPRLNISLVDPQVVYVGNDGKTIQDLQFQVQVPANFETLTNATVTLMDGTNAATSVKVGTLVAGAQQMVTVPKGTQLSVPTDALLVSVLAPAGNTPSVSNAVMAPVYGPGALPPAPAIPTPVCLNTQDPPVNTPGSPPVATPAPTTPTTTGPTPSFTPLCGSSAVLTRVAPELTVAGSGAVPVTLTGINLNSLQQIFARIPGGTWQMVAVTPTSTTSASAIIPAGLLGNSGFVELNTTADDAYSLAFMIASPTLPTPSSSPLDVFIKSTSPSDIGPENVILTVSGSGLKSGMQLVYGRQGVPGVALPTTLSNGALITPLGPYFGAAGDLEVYVMSSDKTQISYPFGVSSGQTLGTAAGIANGETALLGAYMPESEPVGAVSVSSVSIPLTRYTYQTGDSTNVTVQLQGVNLTSGMTAQFQSVQGNDPGGTPNVVTASLSGVTTIPDPSGLGGATSPVPDNFNSNIFASAQATIPRKFIGTLVTTAVLAGTGASSNITSSASITLDKEKGIVDIPLGGRLEVQLYQDAGKNLYIYAPVMDSQPPANSTLVASAGASLSFPTNSGSAIFPTYNGDSKNGPYAQEEVETQGGTAHIYLRGMHLTMEPLQPGQEPQRRVVVPSTFKTMSPPDSTPRQSIRILMTMQSSQNSAAPTADACTLPGNVCRDFDVTLQPMGPFDDYDVQIGTAADEAGIPAPFMKSQFLHDTSLGKWNFRYQLTSVDFKMISGDQPNTVLFPYLSPYVTSGTAVLGTPLTKYFLASDATGAGSNIYTLPSFTGSLSLFTTLPVVFNNDLRNESCEPSRCGVKVYRTTDILLSDGTSKTDIKPREQFSLVRGDPTWRKNCYPVAPCRSAGIFVPAAALESNAGSDLNPGEVLVDYKTGVLTFPPGVQLTQQPTVPCPSPQNAQLTCTTAQRIRVDYVVASAGQTFGDGVQTALNATPALPPPGGSTPPAFMNARPAPSFLDFNQHRVYPGFSPRKTQCAYISANLTNEAGHKDFFTEFLGNSQTDSYIEFVAAVNPSITGASPVFTPTTVRDQRFCLATAQFYAASSYGISLVSPADWQSQGSFPQASQMLPNPIYAPILDITNTATPIYTLLTDYHTGALLTGARLHQIAATAAAAAAAASSSTATPGPTNRMAYETSWSGTFAGYNKSGFGYTLAADKRSGIITQGSACFEPALLISAANLPACNFPAASAPPPLFPPLPGGP